MHKKLHDTRHKTIIYAIRVTDPDRSAQVITIDDIHPASFACHERRSIMDSIQFQKQAIGGQGVMITSCQSHLLCFLLGRSFCKVFL
jgi:hypothetical protein